MTHPSIDATLSLRREHSIVPAQIEAITVRVSESAALQSQPLDQKRRPPTSVAAKFSIPFCVALAASHNEVSLDHFHPAALQDPAVMSMVDRVQVESVYSLKAVRGVDPSIVDITLKDGRTLTRRIDIVHGHHRNPMSYEDVATKFAACARHGRQELSAERVQTVIDLVRRIESHPNAAVALMDCVSG